MRKAGGIIALVAGIFATLAAIVTLSVGGLGSAFQAEGAETVIWLGVGGVFFSFLTIILGAVAIGAKSRNPGMLLILSSIAGATLGGTFVAVFMVLALIGGVLASTGNSNSNSAQSIEKLTSSTVAVTPSMEALPSSFLIVAAVTVPLWGVFLQWGISLAISDGSQARFLSIETSTLWLLGYLFINSALCELDSKRLKRYGVDVTDGNILAVILVPVYFFMRGKRMREAYGESVSFTQGPSIAWWVCLVLGVILDSTLTTAIPMVHQGSAQAAVAVPYAPKATRSLEKTAPSTAVAVAPIQAGATPEPEAPVDTPSAAIPMPTSAAPAYAREAQQPPPARLHGNAQQYTATVSAETPVPLALDARARPDSTAGSRSTTPEAPVGSRSVNPTPLEETVAGLPAPKRTAYPSFDCSSSRNYAEDLICNNDELSALDNQMVSAYEAKLKNSDNSEVIRKQQQEWLNYRNRCANSACIRERDQQRLQDLQ
jgi:uncharacterized protein YecT (DUF1311 family)